MNGFLAWFFRLQLRLYPRDFRDTYGGRMEEAFAASLERQSERLGLCGVPYAVLRTLADTLVSAAVLHFRRGGYGASRRAASPDPLSGPTSTRRGAGWGECLSGLVQDMGFVVRGLRKNPTFTTIVVLVAGLGITLSTLVLTTINASFFRPLPHVQGPEEVLRVSRRSSSAPGRPLRLAYQDYAHLLDRSTTLQNLVGAVPSNEFMLRIGEGADRKVLGGEVTANYFQALGIPMVLGRGILPEDGDSEAHVAVLGHATWMRSFGGDRNALGQTILVDGGRYTVVGVAPPGLGWLSGEPMESAVWIPVRKRFRENPGWHGLAVAGRRSEGASLSQVQAEYDALAAGLSESDPDRWTESSGDPIGLRIQTDRQARLDLIGGPRGMASILIYFVFVGLILLITCSNVASLLLNRAFGRRSEIALRLALGAGRGRLIRLLLTESVVLFLLAGSASLLLIHWGTQLLAAGWGAFLPAVADITVDGQVIIVTTGITVLCGLVFGAAPALQATRPDLSPALRGQGRRNRVRGRFSLRNFFVLAQVAASMVLVAISALLVKDVRGAGSLDIGFEPRGVLVASLNLSHGEYAEEDGRRWLDMLSSRLETLSGVEGVSLSAWVPMSGSRWGAWIRPEGVELDPDEARPAAFNSVTPGYFELVGMPMLAGRGFLPSDDATAPPVMVVNQAFVRRYWPSQEPLGKGVAFGPDAPSCEVVGVVRDAMYGISDLRNGQAEPHVWVPRAQAYYDPVSVHVRTSAPEAPLLVAIRDEIRALDEDLPVIELARMENLTAKALLEERAATALFSGFGALALLLAALGIYGVMAHTVMVRTRELGVRMAVGARPGRVVRMVLADSLRLSALGILIGLGLSVLVGMGIQVLLVGSGPFDPLSVTGSVSVLILSSLAAALSPALRAARTDPVRSLKSE